MSAQAARRIAEFSEGLPRMARLHLEGLRLMFPDAEKRKIGLDDVRGYLTQAGYDERG